MCSILLLCHNQTLCCVETRIVWSNVHEAWLAARHSQQVEAGGEGEQGDGQLRLAARVHGEHRAEASHPEAEESVDLPDGEGRDKLARPERVSKPGARQADEPLQEVAQGGQKPVKWQTEPL